MKTKVIPFPPAAFLVGKPILRALAWSLCLHAAFVMVLVAVTGQTRKEAAPITVVLAGDLPAGTGGNGPGRSPPKRNGTNGKNGGNPDPGRQTEQAPVPFVSGNFASAPVTANRKEIDPKPGLDDAISLVNSAGREAGSDGTHPPCRGDGCAREGPRGAFGPGGGAWGGTAGAGRGSGGGHGSGNGGDGSYLAANFSSIRSRILERLTYPPQARRMGWKGRVTVFFVISEDGRVEHIRVLASSGYALLDENAVRAIRSCEPFPRPPARAEVIIPIVYRIG